MALKRQLNTQVGTASGLSKTYATYYVETMKKRVRNMCRVTHQADVRVQRAGKNVKRKRTGATQDVGTADEEKARESSAATAPQSNSLPPSVATGECEPHVPTTEFGYYAELPPVREPTINIILNLFGP